MVIEMFGVIRGGRVAVGFVTIDMLPTSGTHGVSGRTLSSMDVSVRGVVGVISVVVPVHGT